MKTATILKYQYYLLIYMIEDTDIKWLDKDHCIHDVKKVKNAKTIHNAQKNVLPLAADTLS